MNDQQLLIYRTWLYEGTGRLVPLDTRPGWWWIQVKQGATWLNVRALRAQDAARLTEEAPHGP